MLFNKLLEEYKKKGTNEDIYKNLVESILAG